MYLLGNQVCNPDGFRYLAVGCTSDIEYFLSSLMTYSHTENGNMMAIDEEVITICLW
jgi:hypothetical protein